jgi:hypothetical protein
MVMFRGLLVRLLLSAIASACFAFLLWDIGTEQPDIDLPFRWERNLSDNSYRVHARPGAALPVPLAEDDVIDLAAMSAADRIALVHPDQMVPGASLTLGVIHGGHRVRTLVRVAAQPRTRLWRFNNWIGLGDMTFLMAIAMLTLWRGRDWTAWGLFALSFASLFTNSVRSLALEPFTAFWIYQLSVVVDELGFIPALYLMAESLTAAGWPRWAPVLARTVVACGVLLILALRFADDSARTHAGILLPPALQTVRHGLEFLFLLLITGTLLIGYHRAARESRLRIRWVLLSTAVLVCSLILQNVVSRAEHPFLDVCFRNLLPGIAVLGYLYAILRTRVVDVAFVIDRAVVYSIITAMVFGAFSLLEQGVHFFAVSPQLSWLLQSLAAVLIAVLLSPLHRLLERGVERVLFHELRAIATSIRRLARQSSFFESEEALLSRTLEELMVPCAAAAIYERSGGRYQCRKAQGQAWPEDLGADDPLFVELRAEHEELDIHGLRSAAATEGRAFPMLVGERLTGAVVCRPRDGEQLDPDVRSAIADLARSLGSSLYLLRHQELERLIAELAAGGLDPTNARTRAAALLASA